MSSDYRVLVIGGGVVGASVLYHLTKRGWSDVALIERDELTSGATWHAAGGFHTLNGDPNVAKLQEYTIKLYEEIEEISGQATGCHVTGGVMLVSDEELERRRAGWQPPEKRFERGYGYIFSRHVTQADKGCDFDFLETGFGRSAGEPDIF